MEAEISEMLDAKRQAYLHSAHVDSKPINNKRNF